MIAQGATPKSKFVFEYFWAGHEKKERQISGHIAQLRLAFGEGIAEYFLYLKEEFLKTGFIMVVPKTNKGGIRIVVYL